MSLTVCSLSNSSCYHVQLRRQPKPSHGSLATTSVRERNLSRIIKRVAIRHSRNPPSTESQPPLEPGLSTSSSHPYVLEPTISLPDKFNGRRAYLCSFINQIRLIIRLQPQRYASDFSRVGLVVTLLSRSAQAWFAPLVETSSPLLENFTAFFVKLEAAFGETDRRQTTLTNLYSFQQGSHPALSTL